MSQRIEDSLKAILQQYGDSFGAKIFGEESVQEDDLMLVFGLTQKVGRK